MKIDIRFRKDKVENSLCNNTTGQSNTQSMLSSSRGSENCRWLRCVDLIVSDLRGNNIPLSFLSWIVSGFLTMVGSLFNHIWFVSWHFLLAWFYRNHENYAADLMIGALSLTLYCIGFTSWHCLCHCTTFTAICSDFLYMEWIQSLSSHNILTVANSSSQFLSPP